MSATMHYRTFAPHPRLAPFLMHILVCEMEAGESHYPAVLPPVLLMFARGGVMRVEPDGAQVRHPRFSLLGPSMSPRESLVEPGTVFVSMMFRPGFIQDVLTVCPADLCGTAPDLRDFIDPARIDRLHADIDRTASHDKWAALFQQFLLDTLDLSRKPGLGARFMAAHRRMFDPLIDIALHFGVGERQLERYVRKTFGMTLRDVRRLARFGNALPVLLYRTVARGDLAHIAHDAGYYDQAHMHREFLDLAGISPQQLLDKVAGRDPAYWAYQLAEADFRKLCLPDA